MSKELSINPKTGLPTNLANIATAIRKSADVVASDVKPFVKFTKYGEWIYGTDETEIDSKSESAINPLSAGVGYVGWGDKEHGNEGTPQGEHFAHPVAGEPLLDKEELHEIDGQWLSAVKLEFKGMDGGPELVWKANSAGARNCYKAIMTKVAERLEAENTHCVPVVTMGKSFYNHTKYGKIFTPTLDVSYWTDMKGNKEK